MITITNAVLSPFLTAVLSPFLKAPVTALVLGAVITLAQAVFIDGLDDFPVIMDLEVAEDPVVFDSPKGTIAELILQGPQPAARYLAVYAESLRSFGWRCKPLEKMRLVCAKPDKKLDISTIPTETDAGKLRVKIAP